MEYSWRYKRALMGVFHGNSDVALTDVTNMETTLDNHNAFNKLFVIDVSSDEIEMRRVRSAFPVAISLMADRTIFRGLIEREII